MKTRSEQETNQMKAYQKQQDEIVHIKKFIASAGTYANLVRQAKSRQKILDKMEADGLIEPVAQDRVFTFRFADVEKLPPPVLSLTMSLSPTLEMQKTTCMSTWILVWIWILELPGWPQWSRKVYAATYHDGKAIADWWSGLPAYSSEARHVLSAFGGTAGSDQIGSRLCARQVQQQKPRLSILEATAWSLWTEWRFADRSHGYLVGRTEESDCICVVGYRGPEYALA